MILSDNHLFMTASTDIKALISPLKKYNINYFTYNKNYTDGSRIRLTTHANHLKAFLEKEYYKSGNIDAHPTLYLNQAALFSSLKNQSLVAWLKEDFGVDNGIYIIRKYEQYTEFFSFATPIMDTSVITNFYLNNLDFLQDFCDYFLDQGQLLITEAEKTKVIHDYNQQQVVSSLVMEKNDFLYLPSLQSIKINKCQQNIIECLLQGQRAKQIAVKLNKSPRTIEDYIADLKNKFQAKNILELILMLERKSLKLP